MCDRNLKENFSAVDPYAVLERLVSIPVQSWNFKAQSPSIRHMGPVSQDFFGAFGVGADDKHIATIDADGVAFAAIQGLRHILEEREQQISQMESRVQSLRKRLAESADTSMSQLSLFPSAGALVLLALLAIPVRRRAAWTALVFLLTVATISHAETIHVDPGIVDINDEDGKCSLIEAIINARENQQLHIDCPRGSSDDTIELSPGSIYTIVTPYDFIRALPPIFGRTILEGNGAVIELADRDSALVILAIGSSGLGGPGPMKVRNLTVRHGLLGIGNTISSALTVINCTIMDCYSLGCGGGIAAEGPVTVINSTLSHNSANEGGAICSEFGAPITVINSTLSHNWVDTPNCRGLPCDGSAIMSRGILTILNSTITQNINPIGTEGGVSVAVFRGEAFIANSIIADQAEGSGCSGGPLVTSLGHNLDSDGSCGFTAPSDLPSGFANLGPLEDNGGPTLTHALLAGSDALDAGSPASPGSSDEACQPTDQRGVLRPHGSACDIGAYEVIVRRGDGEQCAWDLECLSVACVDNVCTTLVPTVSTWGLVLLTLTLLVAAKLRFRLQGSDGRTARSGFSALQLGVALIVFLASAANGIAQNQYSILPWYTVDGGGGAIFSDDPLITILATVGQTCRVHLDAPLTQSL